MDLVQSLANAVSSYIRQRESQLRMGFISLDWETPRGFSEVHSELCMRVQFQR